MEWYEEEVRAMETRLREFPHHAGPVACLRNITPIVIRGTGNGEWGMGNGEWGMGKPSPKMVSPFTLHGFVNCAFAATSFQRSSNAAAATLLGAKTPTGALLTPMYSMMER